MQEFNFQELLSLADEKIDNARKQEILKKQEEDRKKILKTEKLALSIQKMVIEILMNINSNSGIVHDLSDISEYGEPNQTKWTLDESKFQITLDFSYSISDDVLFYTGPRGLTVDSIDWEYLCKLLQEKNIIINHNKSRFHEDEPNWYGTTYYTDVLTITLERTKKMQSDESIIDPKIPKKQQ